jgi:hypothetical protein
MRLSQRMMVTGLQSVLLMDDEQRERMNEICAKLQVEQDQHKFTELLKQLNNLLERKGQYLEQKAETEL